MGDTGELVSSVMDKFDEITEDVWIIGFSGGKDSSLLVDLAVEYVYTRRPEIELHVIYADTMLEYPLVHSYALKFLAELDRFAKDTALKVKTYITKPLRHKDFLYLQLSKRYPMPHRKFRWCTEKLKIMPAKRVIKKIIGSYGSNVRIAILNGARLDESGHRAQLMKRRLKKTVQAKCRDCTDPVTGYIRKYSIKEMKRLIGEDFTSTLPIYVTRSTGFGAPLKVYSPLAYLLEDDVWNIITERRKPFFTNKTLYDELLKIYGRHEPTYKGKIRFGCWLCTVATRDKSGEYYSIIIPETRILVWARKALFLISHGANPVLRSPPRFYNQRYSGLNDKGLELTRAIYVVVLDKYIDALRSYFEERRYFGFIRSIVEEFDINKTMNLIDEVRKEIIIKMNEKTDEINPNILGVLADLENYIIGIEKEKLLAKLEDYYRKIKGENSTD